MADLVIAKRKEKKLTQAQLAEMTGIHRAMISRLEALDYIPSIDQLQAIAEALGFEVTDLFEEEKPVATKPVLDKKYNIAVAGTGYLSLIHISEPTRRTPISYAVFCLKKKKKKRSVSYKNLRANNKK